MLAVFSRTQAGKSLSLIHSLSVVHWLAHSRSLINSLTHSLNSLTHSLNLLARSLTSIRTEMKLLYFSRLLVVSVALLLSLASAHNPQ